MIAAPEMAIAATAIITATQVQSFIQQFEYKADVYNYSYSSQTNSHTATLTAITDMLPIITATPATMPSSPANQKRRAGRDRQPQQITLVTVNMDSDDDSDDDSNYDRSNSRNDSCPQVQQLVQQLLQLHNQSITIPSRSDTLCAGMSQ